MPDLDADSADDFLDHLPLCPEDTSFAAFLVDALETEAGE